MQGLMMDRPLIITSLIQYAARYHGDTEIVSRTIEGPIHRYGYRDSYARVKKLANALTNLGVGQDDRIATLAWNGYRHFELYYGISGIGAICHTINPRLSQDQIAYIVNHAEDRYIFVDLTFVPILEQACSKFDHVEGFVVLTDADHMPDTTLPNALCYEDFIGDQPEDFDWPEFDETQAADDVLDAIDLYGACPDVDVGELDRHENFAERYAVGAHRIGINVDLVLLHVASDGGHLGDALR